MPFARALFKPTIPNGLIGAVIGDRFDARLSGRFRSRLQLPNDGAAMCRAINHFLRNSPRSTGTTENHEI